MKKFFRFAAIIFCMGILMTALAACGKEDSEESDTKHTAKATKPVESPEPTEEVTPEPTTEPTEAPTPEPTQPPKDVVLSFYQTFDMKEIAEFSLAELFGGNNYSYYCKSFITDEPDGNGGKLYRTEYGPAYKISDAPGEGNNMHDAEIYHYFAYKKRTIDRMVIRYETEGVTGEIEDFAPLYYNETRGCLAGYRSNAEKTEFSFVELYYSPTAGGLALYPADWKNYDFPDHSGTQTNYYNNKAVIAISSGKVFTCEIDDGKEWGLLRARIDFLIIGDRSTSRAEYTINLADVSELSQKQIDEKWADITILGEQDGWVIYDVPQKFKSGTMPTAVRYIDQVEISVSGLGSLDDLTKKLGAIGNMIVQ